MYEAFAVPSIAMAVAIVAFLAGTKFYCRDDEETNKKEGSIISKTAQCIYWAIMNKIRMKKVKKNHWLDYADDKFSLQMLNDVKAFLNVVLVFLPVPFYWVLFDQQGKF